MKKYSYIFTFHLYNLRWNLRNKCEYLSHIIYYYELFSNNESKVDTALRKPSHNSIPSNVHIRFAAVQILQTDRKCIQKFSMAGYFRFWKHDIFVKEKKPSNRLKNGKFDNIENHIILSSALSLWNWLPNLAIVHCTTCPCKEKFVLSCVFIVL